VDERLDYPHVVSYGDKSILSFNDTIFTANPGVALAVASETGHLAAVRTAVAFVAGVVDDE